MISIDESVKIIIVTICGLGVILSAINLPGALVVFVGLCILAYFTGIGSIGLSTFLIFAFLALFTVFIDNLATLIGASKYGASKTAIMGVVIGSVAGFLIFQPIGVILGPLAGGVLGEIYAKRSVIFHFFYRDSKNVHTPSNTNKPMDSEIATSCTSGLLDALKVGWGLLLGFLAGFIIRLAVTLFLSIWIIKILWF